VEMCTQTPSNPSGTVQADRRRQLLRAFGETPSGNINEFAWRFDWRESETLFIDTLEALIHAPTPQFAKLTAENAVA
jgi:hypothetical protein